MIVTGKDYVHVIDRSSIDTQAHLLTSPYTKYPPTKTLL